MDENDDVAWAHEVAAQGWPAKDMPIAQRRAAYEELESAYYALQADALANGYDDRALSYAELADRAYLLAVECRGPEDQRW